MREALSEALQDLELPRRRHKERVHNVSLQSKSWGVWSAPLLVDIAEAFRLVRSMRLTALYAGLVPSLLAVVPTALVYMPTYEMASGALRPVVAKELVPPLAGVLTGIACATVRVPASVLKSRVQLGLAPSATVALRRAIKAGGVRELYVGFSATLVLDVCVAVVQFTALDLGRRTPGLLSSPAVLGFVASALATAVTEPIDVVRTRIMARVKGQPNARFNYTSVVDGIASATRSEGFAALYRGLLPRLALRSFGGAIWYSTYVYSREALASLQADATRAS